MPFPFYDVDSACIQFFSELIHCGWSGSGPRKKVQIYITTHLMYNKRKDRQNSVKFSCPLHTWPLIEFKGSVHQNLRYVLTFDSSVDWSRIMHNEYEENLIYVLLNASKTYNHCCCTGLHYFAIFCPAPVRYCMEQNIWNTFQYCAIQVYIAVCPSVFSDTILGVSKVRDALILHIGAVITFWFHISKHVKIELINSKHLNQSY